MAVAERQEIWSALASLPSLAAWAEAFCERHRVPAKANFAAQLCLEEAVSNAIRHGGLPAEARIGIVLTLETAAGGGDRLVIDVTDPGVAFDPLTAEPPAKPTSLESTSIGGQGILLMRRFCEAMAYHRRDGLNHLRLVIQLHAGS